MSIINVLNVALNVLGSQDVGFRRYLNTTITDDGIREDTFAPAITVKGAAQQMSSALVQKLKLDSNKQHMKFWLPADVTMVEPPKGNDVIIYNGYNWAIIEQEDWYNYNGWVGVVAVKGDAV